MHGDYVIVRKRDDLVEEPYEVTSVINGKRSTHCVVMDDPSDSIVRVTTQNVLELIGVFA